MVILLLVGAYRSLGAGTAPPVSTPALLSVLLEDLRSSLAALPRQGTAVPLQSALAPSLRSKRDGTASDPTRDARRRLAGVVQRLDDGAPAAQLSDVERSATDLLRAAAEDASWAWRMVQSGDLGPGLSAAVTALQDHARDCCEEVERLLGRSARTEPVHSSC